MPYIPITSTTSSPVKAVKDSEEVAVEAASEEEEEESLWMGVSR